MTKQYRVKGIPGIQTHIELMNQVAGGYEARITSVDGHGVRESCEFISDDLLESCLRTGYICEAVEAPAEPLAAEPVLAS